MGRCNTNSALGGCIVCFILIGTLGSFLSLAFTYGISADSKPFESFLFKNTQSMVWYDCIDMISTANMNTYLLKNKPQILDASMGQSFNFVDQMKNLGYSYVFDMHLLPGSQVNVAWEFQTGIDLYFLKGHSNYDKWLNCRTCFDPVASNPAGSYNASITDADYYYWAYYKGSQTGIARYTGVMTLYNMTSGGIIDKAINNGQVCLDWSDRDREFYVAVEAPQQQLCNDACWTGTELFQLVWTRRWSFVLPILFSIFFIVAVLIPGVMAFVLFRRIRHQRMYEVPTEYSTYAPQYTAPPSTMAAYNNAPSNAYQYQPYSQAQAPQRPY